MKTLTIAIPDKKYRMFGIRKNNLRYSDFRKLVITEYFRQQMDKCLKSAEECGLSKMTMEEITEEVRAVRREYAQRSN